MLEISRPHPVLGTSTFRGLKCFFVWCWKFPGPIQFLAHQQGHRTKNFHFSAVLSPKSGRFLLGARNFQAPSSSWPTTPKSSGFRLFGGLKSPKSGRFLCGARKFQQPGHHTKIFRVSAVKSMSSGRCWCGARDFRCQAYQQFSVVSNLEKHEKRKILVWW